MIFTLLKVRFAAMFAALTRRNSQGKTRGVGMIILFIILYLYVAACMFGMFFGLFIMLAPLTFAAGCGWLVYSIAGILAFALSLFGSIFMVKSQLYEAKDNELLLSMPVSTSAILASRFLYLYVTTLLYELVVILPAALAVTFTGNASFAGLAFLAVLSLLLPLLTLSLAGVFAFVIALFSSRTSRKTLVSIIFSIVFLVGYFYMVQNANEIINAISQNITRIADALISPYSPIFLFGDAAVGNPISFLIVSAICIVPFAIAAYVMSKSFISIITRKPGSKRIRYRERALGVASPIVALTKKELKRFTSSAVYFMNCGIGGIMLIIASGVLIFKSGDVANISVEAGLTDIDLPKIILSAIPAAFLFCASTSSVSAPSISLEGRSIWIAQSIPVSGSAVLMSKVYAHLAVGLLPPVIFSAVASIVFSADLLMFISLLLLSVMTTVFIALLGLLINLRYYKLDWINEMVPIKQGASVGLIMLTGMGLSFITAGTCVVIGLLLPAFIGPLFWSALFAVLSLVMYKYIMGKGGKKFETLA